LKWIWTKFADPIKGLLQSKGRFSRGVTAILSGTVVSRLIALATIPILSRLFAPEDFGILALFGMITATLGTLINGRYEAAIVLPEKEEDAINVLGVCLGLCTIISLLLGVVFYYYSEPISIFFGAPELTLWLYWSPFCIWTIGVFTALRHWSSRTDDFKGISIATIGDIGSMAATQIGLGLLFRGMLTGLMLGPYVGRLIKALILTWRIAKADGKRIKRALNFPQARSQAVRYRHFPLYDLPASLLSTFSREMPTGILGVFFVTYWIGLYSIANRILTVPIQVLAAAIAQVYLPVASDAKKSGRLDVFTLSVFDRLLGISLTPMFIVALAAPELIYILLGERWVLAGTILQYLMPSLLMVFIASPLTAIFSVLERQQEKLVFNTALFITRFVSLVIGGLLGDPIIAIIMYSASGAIFWLLQCFWILRMSNITSQMILKHVSTQLLWTLPFLIFVTGVEYFYPGSPRRIALAAIIALSVFLALRWKEFLGPGTITRSPAS
jgi:O-antigen/teichoic acid export membrane protein